MYQPSTDQIFEYAHGQTEPEQSLVDLALFPMGCSVDPTTGNLAVANLAGQGGPPGSIYVYSQGGVVTAYTNPAYAYYWAPGYDDRGNLFVEVQTLSGKNELAELPEGGRSLITVRMNHAIHYPGGVQWDGTYLAVGDQMYDGRGVTGIYRTKIVGTRATVIGSLELSGTCGTSDILQFAIAEGRVVGPDVSCNTLAIYPYPRGGKPDARLRNYSATTGATFSIVR